MRHFSWMILVLTGLVSVQPAGAESNGRVTILYDAFGNDSSMMKDWGYAALIEFDGKRILFDTGNDPEIFAANVKAAGANLSELDFAVISHRHLDHTAGISILQRANPGVKIYAPKENFGPFGSSLPSTFFRKEESLPDAMRYFDGHPPETLHFGTAWTGANFVAIEKTEELLPNVWLIATVSDLAGTKELREISLAIKTAQGIVLVVGCSHPGIERIVAAAAAIDPRVHLIFGGFHLPAASDADVTRVAAALHDEFKVENLAPGHCTGELAFARFSKLWGGRYFYAGVGRVIPIPSARP